MGLITLPTTLADGTVPTAAQFMGDFNAIVNEFNGNIEDSNVKSGADINVAKIAGTAVSLLGSQTISNKTLLKMIQTIVTDADGATITFDATAGQIHVVTLGGNRTLAVSGMSAGQAIMIKLINDTGGRTVTWFSGIDWVGGATPTLTTTAGNANWFVIICRDTNKYDGFILGEFDVN